MSVSINNHVHVYNMHIGPTMPTKGLVSCWDAASVHSYPRTGSTWYDLVKKTQNNGSLEGMSNTNFVEGVGGASFTLNGADEYITVPSDDSLNMGSGSFSVVGWFKISAATVSSYGDGSYLIGKQGLRGGSNIAGWSVQVRATSGGWSLGSALVSDATNTTSTNTLFTVADDTWAMVSLVYDSVNKKLKYYINNDIQVSHSFSTTIGSISNTIPLEIFGTTYTDGGDTGSLLEVIGGSVASLAIYNTDLSDQNIADIYILSKDKHLNV